MFKTIGDIVFVWLFKFSYCCWRKWRDSQQIVRNVCWRIVKWRTSIQIWIFLQYLWNIFPKQKTIDCSLKDSFSCPPLCLSSVQEIISPSQRVEDSFPSPHGWKTQFKINLFKFLQCNFCWIGEKPFSCSICSRAFSHKSTLNEHMNLHSDDRPYACDVCHRRFKQRKSLRAHRCE